MSRGNATRARLAHRGEDGFSLIELVIVLVTLPIVVGAIATVVITVLNNTTAATQSIFDSADSQITSVNFVRDVQSAAFVTTSANPPTAPGVCSPSPPKQFPSPHLLLALRVATSSGSSGNLGVVSYWWVATTVKVLGSPTTEAELVRQVCPNGSNPGGSTVVAHDISSITTPPTVAITGSQAQGAGSDWAPTTGITGISLSAVEPASRINFRVLAVPRAWSSGTGGTGS
jgi:Tfp pilus assembly protein PilW